MRCILFQLRQQMVHKFNKQAAVCTQNKMACGKKKFAEFLLKEHLTYLQTVCLLVFVSSLFFLLLSIKPSISYFKYIFSRHLIITAILIARKLLRKDCLRWKTNPYSSLYFLLLIINNCSLKSR